MDNLLFRRQFVFSPNKVDNRPGWNTYSLLDKFFLYAHPDLVQTDISEKAKRIILLGDIYDPLNPKLTNEEIVARVIQQDDIMQIIESTFQYAGRFAFIVQLQSELFIFHDASGSRKVFYTTQTDKCWCASQAHVLSGYCEIPETTNEKILALYRSQNFLNHQKVSVMNNTIYDSIKQLQPNHYLDVQQQKAIRFWPRRKNELISLDEGVEIGSKMLSGIIEAASNRYGLMMAVTAGNDTRMLLAASRKVSDKIFYYINKIPRYTDKSSDMVTSKRIFEKINLPFNVLEFDEEVNDDAFRKAFKESNQFANDVNLGMIYNIYYKQFPDKINMPGRFSDISRNFFSTYHKTFTPELLAKIWEYDGIEYVIEEYGKWLEEASTLVEKYNYRLLELFNWEERNGNLYTAFQMDKDIAQEEFTPYNCRKLMEVYLSVPNKYRDVHSNIYYKAMIKKLWPELLEIPINPDQRRTTGVILKKVGLFWLARRFTKGF